MQYNQFLVHCVSSANAANASGQFSAAIGWCQQALRKQPNLPEAWYNLGLAFCGLDQIQNAVDALLNAATLTHNNPDAQNSIGLQFIEIGAYSEAERCLQRSLAIAPNYAFAYSNLGKLREKQDRLNEAEAAFRKAVELQPDLAPAYANLGGALNRQKNYEAAAMACRKSIELDPQSAVAWSNLGAALVGTNRYEAAVDAARKSLELDPESANTWSNLGNALFRLSRVDEAKAACEEALSLDPELLDPHATLAWVLLAKGVFEGALEEFQKALRKDPDHLETLSNKLFCLNYVPGVAPAEILSVSSDYERAACRNVVPFTSWLCVKDSGRKLRIGMISGDFRRHPVGYFLKGPLRELNKAQFEIVAYSHHTHSDDLTEDLRSHCAAWSIAVGISDAELAQQIYHDRIDILIDLSGHTDRNRLPVFAWKPAPIQVTWLGYFATTGVKAIDWKIGDFWVTPVQEEDHFTENIWRLPDSCFCFSPPLDAPDVAELPSKANGFITYGCFNNLVKVNDDVIEVWSRILLADAKSKLFLKSPQLSSKEFHQSLWARFERFGITQDRLILEGQSSLVEYLDAYGRVDIALDPFPFPGGTTTSEGLWMGVPVVTLKGDRFIAHQGESLLNAAGLAGCIASNKEEYVNIALNLAANQDLLAATRADMRTKISLSPLFDAARFARNLEVAWRGMWQEWCNTSR